MKGIRVRPALELPVLPVVAAPWPPDRPLDVDAVKAALWHAGGNLTKAGELLQCPAARIGRLLARDPALAEERKLAAELMVDRAESVMLEAMSDEDDKLRRDEAARFVLNHAGKGRGWGKDGGSIALAFGSGTSGAAQVQGGALQIRWESEQPAPPKVIEHDPTP